MSGDQCFACASGLGGDHAFWCEHAPKRAKPAQQDAPTDAQITTLYGKYCNIVDGEFIASPGQVALAGRALLAKYAPAQDAERERDAGIEAAARWIDTRRDDFDREHGYEDPDTGAWEYGTGPHAEAKREYSFELAEIAEGLRALKSDAARAQRADKEAS